MSIDRRIATARRVARTESESRSVLLSLPCLDCSPLPFLSYLLLQLISLPPAAFLHSSSSRNTPMSLSISLRFFAAFHLSSSTYFFSSGLRQKQLPTTLGYHSTLVYWTIKPEWHPSVVGHFWTQPSIITEVLFLYNLSTYLCGMWIHVTVLSLSLLSPSYISLQICSFVVHASCSKRTSHRTWHKSHSIFSIPSSLISPLSPFASSLGLALSPSIPDRPSSHSEPPALSCRS